jgi:ABC-2 type transport system permease protein
VVLLLLAIWGVIYLSAKVYRIGVLMYGKRPTLPELVRWVRYS